jgi:transcriptional regulator GlxA family with amidase domain
MDISRLTPIILVFRLAREVTLSKEKVGRPDRPKWVCLTLAARSHFAGGNRAETMMTLAILGKATQGSRVFFVVLDRVNLLELAGPAQVFHAAVNFGARYALRFCAAPEAKVYSSLGLHLDGFDQLAAARPGPSDLIFIPGVERRRLNKLAPCRLVRWLVQAYERGATLCSLCTGAFVLAQAGLLDERRCTTHWSRVNDLRTAAPRSLVESDALFVEDDRIYTSAGVSSGIDLALFILENRNGPLLATKVARELVIYLRRDGAHSQNSIYLDYRNHFRAGVHRVQDWLIQNPSRRGTLPELAKIAGLSPRHLSRVFRAATGVTIGRYKMLLRLARSRTLSFNPELTQSAIASEVGYQDSRQLRRIRRANCLVAA